jgi:hypothetical protein
VHVVCDTEPTPACASFSFGPFAFTWATKAFRSFAGKSFLATMRIGVPAASPTGSKSRVGLYLRFGYTAGAAPCVPMCPIMIV